MIQLSPYYCTSITEACDNDLWTAQEQEEMIQRHEARERRLFVKRNPGAGKHFELSTACRSET
jgi:hypothetical protein